ncbi:NADH-quinone oxidoreductase subunit NuoH [Sphingopyxis sp. KK2]|uniref:NADH-quinone oxidoreductase subunit NuoH n=1 Tax=Sphingopyxis sp. KK2 TaxID=1855727 RepID=UPI0021174788|nr:NADH-quinone oxidoreductase subunit NuoH [Sphingopyxis sp. KK2]
MTETFISWGMDPTWAWGVATIAGILLIALPLMLAVAMIIYADRKIWAAIALRRGPNVVGPFGLLQSFADGLKVFLQETIIPTSANRGLFLIAPIITFTVALMAWAVIPFNSGAVLADINVGLLYILAISSLGVYGVILSGWASNSKYPFFSAMRASAQMISYEVSIGFILIGVVLFAGSFNMNEIVKAQQGHGLGIVNAFGFNLLLFPLAVMFLISSLAETARAPFDLTEAESELVAGYQTEYSSMSFALFWLGEYANVLLMCTLNAVLFWGGWLPPLNIDLIPWFDIPGIIWLFAKILFFFFVFSWVKATVPRYRYDQLMRLGWKVFLPISLIWIFLISGYLMLTRYGDCKASERVHITQIADKETGKTYSVAPPKNSWDGICRSEIQGSAKVSS